MSWLARLEDRLLGVFGPAQIGADARTPQDLARRTDSGCPECGAPISVHEVDRSGGSGAKVRLYCPPARPPVATAP